MEWQLCAAPYAPGIINQLLELVQKKYTCLNVHV